jgi:hypothetical protein
MHKRLLAVGRNRAPIMTHLRGPPLTPVHGARGSRPTRKDQSRPRGVAEPVIATASLARAAAMQRVPRRAHIVSRRRRGARHRARIQEIADVHDSAARRPIPRAPASGGVSEPAQA